MAGGDELCENTNPLQGWKFDGPKRWNEELYTRSRTENGC